MIFVAQKMAYHYPCAGMEEARPKQGVNITPEVHPLIKIEIQYDGRNKEILYNLTELAELQDKYSWLLCESQTENV